MQIVDLRDRPAALGTVARWLWQAWGTLHPDRSVEATAASLEQRFLSHADPFPVCLVGQVGGVTVGTAGLVADDGLPPPMDRLSPWLASVYVAPAARGQGHASALVVEMQRRAGAQGFANLYLYTPDQQALYARLGFVHHGQSRDGAGAVDVMRWAATWHGEAP